MVTLAQLREKIAREKEEKKENSPQIGISNFSQATEILQLENPPEFWPMLEIVNRICYPFGKQTRPNPDEVMPEFHRLHAIVDLKKLLYAIFQTKFESVKEIYPLLEEILEEFKKQEASDPDNQLSLPL